MSDTGEATRLAIGKVFYSRADDLGSGRVWSRTDDPRPRAGAWARKTITVVPLKESRGPRTRKSHPNPTPCGAGGPVRQHQQVPPAGRPVRRRVQPRVDSHSCGHEIVEFATCFYKLNSGVWIASYDIHWWMRVSMLNFRSLTRS